MRRGLEEAQSKDAGRRTGTGSEVWYIRDEWARDHEVLHPQRAALYKSGIYALKVTCLTLGDLYSVFNKRLSGEQFSLTAIQKSAEGIVGGRKQVLDVGCREGTRTRPAYRKSRETRTLHPKQLNSDVMPPLKAGTVREG